MTWYANRIYVNDSLGVRAKLREQHALTGHIFLLSGALPSSWEPGAPEIQLPAEGLICIKEIASSNQETSKAKAIADLFGENDADQTKKPFHSWFEPDEFLPWTVLEGPAGRRVLEEAVAAERERPPIGLQRFLGDLHDACRVPVTYYLCSTWGGMVDEEAAWIYGDTDLVCRYQSPTETRVTDRSGERTVQDNVLALVLAHHGIRLPVSGYFAPHTREFDWARHRLSL